LDWKVHKKQCKYFQDNKQEYFAEPVEEEEYESNYGFPDCGMYGFSAEECDDLLEQGVKPWDDDAAAVMAALKGL
jgi:hypothetical protein